MQIDQKSSDELENIIGVEDYIRIKKYLEQAEMCLIEEKYVDKDWREEYSLFYSKTHYESVRKFTTRIHLISEKVDKISDINEKNYMGYIVLRPLPVCRLLKAILKPCKEVFGVLPNEDLYLCVAEFSAHIGGIQSPLKIKTFPFYQQDGMVTACAHASMRMITEYMHRKFGYPPATIRDFVQSTPTEHGRVIPITGLSGDEMLHILTNLGYVMSPITDLYYSEITDEVVESIIRRIDAYLESGLPTILGFDAHVIVIAGHTLDDKGNRDYIIYDDSGYHIEQTFRKEPNIVARITKDELINCLTNTKNILAVNVEFSRLHFPLSSVVYLTKIILDEYLRDIGDIVTRCRYLVVDSREFKIFCNKYGLTVFNNVSLPHYLWLVEAYVNNDLICDFIIDASAHKWDYENSLIAIWTCDGSVNFVSNNIVNFLYVSSKDKKSKFTVGAGPRQYSNLYKVRW